jgi:hypothetical protein
MINSDQQCEPGAAKVSLWRRPALEGAALVVRMAEPSAAPLKTANQAALAAEVLIGIRFTQRWKNNGPNSDV